MTDEHKLHQAAGKAVRAKTLLENDLLAEAFKGLEDAYTIAWRTSSALDTAGREKLHLAINIVGLVRDHLAAIVNNGKLAAAELKELADVAERKKRFGFPRS